MYEQVCDHVGTTSFNLMSGFKSGSHGVFKKGDVSFSHYPWFDGYMITLQTPVDYDVSELVPGPESVKTPYKYILPKEPQRELPFE